MADVVTGLKGNYEMTIPSETGFVQQNLFANEIYSYHDINNKGYFSILYRSNENAKTLSQRTHALALMPTVLPLLNPRLDTYISQNEFFRPNRQLVNLARMSVLFADLDIWHKPSPIRPHDTEQAQLWERDVELAKRWEGMKEAQVIELILQHCSDVGKPLPSLIMSTGRGFYAKYFLERSIPRQALPRYNTLQQAIGAVYEPFRADRNARDASRVLRLESTVNQKTGDICKVVYNQNQSYNFEYLCNEFLPVFREDLERKRAQKQELYATWELQKQQRQDKNQNRNTSGLRPFDAKELNWKRLEDIRKLAELRGGVHEGQRDLYLYHAASFASWVVGYNFNEIYQLGRELTPTLSASEVKSYTSSVLNRLKLALKGEKTTYKYKDEDGKDVEKLVDPRYKFENKTLIKTFSITPAEQKDMLTIIGDDEAKERHRERNRKTSDRATYLEETGADQRRIEARLRRAKGESIRQIAEALGVGKTTVERYIKDGD